MTIQPENKNLNYLIDPTFTNVNRLFGLSFPRNDNTDSRYSYSNYYVPKVEINDFDILIDGKSFFDLPVKNKEAYEKIINMSNNDYTTGNLLDFGYFIVKFLKTTGATMFFIIEKPEETTFKFSKNSVTII